MRYTSRLAHLDHLMKITALCVLLALCGTAAGAGAQGPAEVTIEAGLPAAEFDARMRALASTPNLTIRLAPGLHQTEGWAYRHAWAPDRGWALGQGWTVRGASAGDTTLQLARTAPPDAVAIGGSFVSDVAIAHLTIDGNYNSLRAAHRRSSITATAIALQSGRIDRAHLHDLVVRDFGSGGRTETFPILVGTQEEEPATGVVIERVRAYGWRGGSCTAIATYGTRGAIFRANMVEGHQIAFGGWLTEGLQITGNGTTGVTYGVNVDVFVNSNLLVADNTFAARRYGVVVGLAGPYPETSTFTNIVIVNNLFSGPGQAVTLLPHVRGAWVANNLVVGGSGQTVRNATANREVYQHGNVWRPVGQ